MSRSLAKRQRRRGPRPISRNLLDEEYFEELLPGTAGNGARHYGAVLGEPRSYGVTFRYDF